MSLFKAELKGTDPGFATSWNLDWNLTSLQERRGKNGGEFDSKLSSESLWLSIHINFLFGYFLMFFT